MRAFADALTASPESLGGVTSRMVSAGVVAAAGVPFCGWLPPLAWLAVVALNVGAQERRTRRIRLGEVPAAALDPTAWLHSALYSIAAFWMTARYTGAGQTLGVTLFGLTMFQILARDFTAPRRMAINLTPPVAGVALVQALAAFLRIRDGRPAEILTLLVIPYIIFRTFRAVQQNLERGRSLERAARGDLERSEARYRLLAENSPDVIVRYDLAGQIEYLSPAARAYGWDPDELPGLNVADALHPDELERNRAFLADLAAGAPTPQGAENVWRAHTRDGVEVIFEGRSRPITDEAGRTSGAVAVLRDVTERLALEAELRAKRAEAEAATLAKSQFLANMSHEIRTPLTGVIGFAGLLRGLPRLSADGRRWVERLHTSAEALRLIVDDILDFSKLEAGEVELYLRPFAPAIFLSETLELVGEQARGKGLDLRLVGAERLPAAILGDAARLRQVLLNLLTNAVKFTEAGRITVAATYLEPRSRLIVAVSDTGMGIAPPAAQRLFQRFSQVDSSNTRAYGGSGLGLAICKGLVERMGGEIGLDSEPGVGSTFWFSAPAPIAVAPEPQARPAETFDTAGVGALRILVVDDVATNRELVGAMLASPTVEVTAVGSGPEAVRACAAQRFDVILMDVQMPGMDGLAAAAAIRSEGLNAATPILALTANVLGEHIEACLAAGMNDHVGKPIAPADLVAKIARWTAPASQTAAA